MPFEQLATASDDPAATGASTGLPVADGASLEDKLVGKITGRFVVARYQRGYRWTEPEVRQLLDDLHENAGRPYCLQPVVVKDRGTDTWELVDGQQRLTTLYLLIRHLRISQLKPLVVNRYEMTYETREKSEEYLRTLDEEGSTANIDFHHLYRASKCIEAWFQKFETNERSEVADQLFAALQSQVRIIWYVAPEDLDATELFTRLNVGRIPLDDSELFKALLLSSVSGAAGSADRATEIGTQWDSIERDLRDPDVWAFASSLPGQMRPTRISLLLEVLANQSIDPTPGSFRVFEALRKKLSTGSSAQSLWNDVLGLHATVMGWYRDRNLYHKVGYLVAIGQRLVDLLKTSSTTTRRAFEAHLDDRIRTALDLTPSAAAGLSYQRDGDWPKIERLLLLANIETLRASRHSTERYPFRSHKANEWTLEHIHAQNAQTLNRADQWRQWLTVHRDVLSSMPALPPNRATARDALLVILDAVPQEITSAAFNGVAAEVEAFFSLEDAAAGTEHSVHGISNLALLPGSANAALSNAVFEVKRRKVIELDRQGAYIPVCTRHVFLKYFPGADDGHMHFWSPRDRESYLAWLLGSRAIDGAVTAYLTQEEHVQ